MRVKRAEYIDEYKIKVVFSDGVSKIVDFAPFLKNAKHVFLPLKGIEYFKKFIVDDITLSWPNEADFDPELLYEMGVVIEQKKHSVRVHKTTIKQPAHAFSKKRPQKTKNSGQSN